MRQGLFAISILVLSLHSASARWTNIRDPAPWLLAIAEASRATKECNSLDRWIENQLVPMTRPEAIRILIDLGLQYGGRADQTQPSARKKKK